MQLVAAVGFRRARCRCEPLFPAAVPDELIDSTRHARRQACSGFILLIPRVLRQEARQIPRTSPVEVPVFGAAHQISHEYAWNRTAYTVNSGYNRCAREAGRTTQLRRVI
jgi:hypothetical protein